MPKGIYQRKPITGKTRKILSLAHLGQKSWNKGKKIPMPKCPKCNVDLKDRRSKFCRKCRPVRTGFKHTIATKEKMSKSRIGNKNHNWKGGKNVARIKWKEKRRFWCLERKARKMLAIGNHTFGEWELLKKQYGNTCPCCLKKEPEIKLTEDHIIPLIKGGSNFIENIQPLCKNCNSKKHIKIIKFENSINRESIEMGNYV